jgi:hypothetical protein
MSRRRGRIATRTKRKAKSTRPQDTTSSASSLLIEGSFVQSEFSDDGERLTFHLPNGNSYTISPAESSPEHFWGIIYSAEWHPPELMKRTCAIKASDFISETSNLNEDDARKEYRRPRLYFEREVRAFQETKHQNVLQMYDFWEWEGRGFIAMEKLKGSLGDILYEAEYFDLLRGIRRDKTILAELVRQVFICIDFIDNRSWTA